MTKTLLGLALSALLVLAPAAQAPAALAKDKKPVDPARKICRSETPTGSRLPVSTCHTAADWAQLDAAGAASADRLRDMSSRNGGGQ